jgi:hypothetical protein
MALQTTPGPWRVDPELLRLDIMTQNGKGGYCNMGHIAEMAKYENNMADAILMAVAPELRQVLEALVKDPDSHAARDVATNLLNDLQARLDQPVNGAFRSRGKRK